MSGIDGPLAGRALVVAYAYLNRRERTVAELRARLEREGDIAAAEIDAVVAQLLDYGYLDDRRYARLFTQDKRTLEHWGEERIMRALHERGIDRELIDQALAESASDGRLTGAQRALELLWQRFSAGPLQPRDRDRAFGVLARKGYDSETAAEAVRAWGLGQQGL